MLKRMKMRGFTIIEVVITITIMGILLTLAIVNLQASEISSRDSERKGDVEVLATNLEAFYRTGNGTSPTVGRYPSTIIASGDEATLLATLRDLDIRAAIAPGATNAATTFISATNDTQTTSGVRPIPTATSYVYQPLQSNNTLCVNETQECRKFNIFYLTEADNTVQVVTSKNQ